MSSLCFFHSTKIRSGRGQTYEIEWKISKIIAIATTIRRSLDRRLRTEMWWRVHQPLLPNPHWNILWQNDLIMKWRHDSIWHSFSVDFRLQKRVVISTAAAAPWLIRISYSHVVVACSLSHTFLPCLNMQGDPFFQFFSPNISVFHMRYANA